MKIALSLTGLLLLCSTLVGCAHHAPQRSGGRVTLLEEATDAGEFVIQHRTIQHALEMGPAWFVRQFSVRPVVTPQEQFYGFQLMSLFPGRESSDPLPIRPGDIIQLVNGHSIERPEQFMEVWNSLATASHLSIQLVRDHESLLVTWAIRDAAPSPSVSAASP